MKTISLFWEEVLVTTAEAPAYRGNEAELTKATIRYKTNGIMGEKSVLLRECLRGDKATHNAEICHIYDRLRTINTEYEQTGKKYRVNVVKHFTDEDGNIYVKDLNPSGDIYVYDLLPDGDYLNAERRPKSRFGEFKHLVTDLGLNRPEIIGNIFEQLATLHANSFVVGTLVRWDTEVNHPTLSLFLCRMKNKKSETDTKIFIHDIHNLSESNPESQWEYVQHCIRDLQDLSFDIIRFFKGIGLPQWGYCRYGQVLRELNPELYLMMYESFLWDPKMEIETMAMSRLRSNSEKEKMESQQVVKKMNKKTEEEHTDTRKMFQSDGIFVLSEKKKKIQAFLEAITKENTEFIFDFDGTLTSPLSKNAFNMAFQENGNLKTDIDTADGFVFRKGAIAFLRFLLASGFEVKIYSMGFREIISEVLHRHGITLPSESIFANHFDAYVFSKTDIPIVLNPEKRQIILGDNAVDFSLETLQEPLKIGFLTRGKELLMNKETDFYHMENAGDYIYLYHMFRRFFEE